MAHAITEDKLKAICRVAYGSATEACHELREVVAQTGQEDPIFFSLVMNLTAYNAVRETLRIILGELGEGVAGDSSGNNPGPNVIQ